MSGPMTGGRTPGTTTDASLRDRTPAPPPALVRRRPECYLGGDGDEGGAGRTPESQGRDGGASEAATG